MMTYVLNQTQKIYSAMIWCTHAVLMVLKLALVKTRFALSLPCSIIVIESEKDFPISSIELDLRPIEAQLYQ